MHPRERIQKDAAAQLRIAQAGKRLAELLGLDARLAEGLTQSPGRDADLARLREREATAALIESAAVAAEALTKQAKKQRKAVDTDESLLQAGAGEA